MTHSILGSGTLRREITEALMLTASDAAELYRRMVGACATLRTALPSTELSPEKFAYVATELLLKRELDDVLPELATDIPHVLERLTRLRLLLGFLRALLRIPGVDQLARQIAGLLAPDLPSRQEMLKQIEPGHDFVENLAAPLLDLCLREQVDAQGALVLLARRIGAAAALHGQDTSSLDAWLQEKGGFPPTAGAPVLRVLSIHLVSNGKCGWTVLWVRGVSPGHKIIDLTPKGPEKKVVPDLHGLWEVLRPAASDLVRSGFVATINQLILSVEIESSRALDGFHRATDRRSKQFWDHFGAVTLWPWLDCPDDVAGRRHDGLLHRPRIGVPSETMALHCQMTDLPALRICVGKPVMLVCTEPVWRRQADGLSAAIDTHEDRTVSVLVAGDDGEAFLDCLFAREQSRPFQEVFRAVRQWLTEGNDLHILWTDPDYKANPHRLEMFSP